ncbi:chemotaxis protein CheB [Paraburkholderia mimosarum]|uniref:chemotaxis protein CheB n=1 Tax=Paraburkholderia mimosarum TaxID=312026 RepID=UPI0005622A21|nr:chemotaxis protein CheB [Paraburkholderia mimosarum]
MKERIFVIGASLSGINALSRLVGLLPANFPSPVFITQHVGAHSPGLLPQILSNAGRLTALHPKDTEGIEPGRIYVAPPDRHMLVQRGRIRLSHGPHENHTRPAIDPLFRSAAIAYGPAVVGVVLTGQLDDGTAGLLAVKDRGGTTVVQEPSEATAASMPRSALAHVQVDHCCKLAEMAELFIRLANDDPQPPEQANLDELIEIENRIAEGIFDLQDWWKLEGMSVPCGLNCPVCKSALYELHDKRMMRFRCRAGHAFSAESLLAEQADSRETQLSALFGSLTEEATLAKRLRDAPVYKERVDLTRSLSGKIQGIERESAQVCEWLRALTDLVEPDPDGGLYTSESGFRAGQL